MGKVSWPKPWVFVVAGVGGVAIAVGAFAWVRRSATNFDLAQYTIPVEAEAFTLRITASGTVVPENSVNISPKNAGVLERLLVEQGDRVERGQILARMDQQDLTGQITQAEATVAQAQARLDRARNGNRPEEIAQARARLEQAQQQLQALQAGNRSEEVSQARAQVASAQARLELAQSKQRQYTQLREAGAIAQERFDEVQADARTAAAALAEAQQRLTLLEKGTRAEEIRRAQASVAEAQAAYDLLRKGSRAEDIRLAEAEVAAAQGQIQVVQTRLAETILRAPFAGIITQKYATEGAFVTPTTSASTTTSATSTSVVALANNLEVLAEVPEVDIGQIRSGQAVEIRVDAHPDETFEGRVRLVSPEAVVEQNVTSFQVRVAILTGQQRLLSGMNADLTFLGQTVADALVIPTVAIATEKGQTGVYLPDKDRKPLFRPITIGSTVKDKTQVLEGLKDGQQVFIDFPEKLKPKALSDEE